MKAFIIAHTENNKNHLVSLPVYTNEPNANNMLIYNSSNRAKLSAVKSAHSWFVRNSAIQIQHWTKRILLEISGNQYFDTNA